MSQQVSILLKNGVSHRIHLSAAELAEFDKSSGRDFIGELFEAAGVEPANPIGKILLVEQILLLAEEQKPAAWAEPDTKTRKFLAAVMQALGRPSVTIDLVQRKL